MKSLPSLSDVLVCAFLIVVTVGIGTTVFRSGPKDLRASTTRNLGKVGQACKIVGDNLGMRMFLKRWTDLMSTYACGELTAPPTNVSGAVTIRYGYRGIPSVNVDLSIDLLRCE